MTIFSGIYRDIKLFLLCYLCFWPSLSLCQCINKSCAISGKHVIACVHIWISKYIKQCLHAFYTQLKSYIINSLRPRQNGRLFADDTFKRIFLNEDIRISTKNSLKFVPKDLINNIPALFLIMTRRPGDKPSSEPMLVRSLTHICVTRPQWVK